MLRIKLIRKHAIPIGHLLLFLVGASIFELIRVHFLSEIIPALTDSTAYILIVSGFIIYWLLYSWLHRDEEK